MATGQRFVECRIVTAIQLVDDHLPDGVAAAGAVLCVADALVRHAEVKSVGPDGHAAQRRRNRRIVDEKLVGHHVELFVAADAQVRSADADDRTVGDVGEPLDHQTVAGHLGQPVVVGAVRPVFAAVLAGDREGGDLVAASVEILDARVVGVLVRHEKRS